MGLRLSPGREEASRGGGSDQAGAGRAEGGLQTLVAPWPALCRCCLGRPAPLAPTATPHSSCYPTQDEPVCSGTQWTIVPKTIKNDWEMQWLSLSSAPKSEFDVCVRNVGAILWGQGRTDEEEQGGKKPKGCDQAPQEDEKGQPLPQPPVTDLKLQ